MPSLMERSAVPRRAGRLGSTGGRLGSGSKEGEIARSVDWCSARPGQLQTDLACSTWVLATCGHQSAIGGSRLGRPGPRASGADTSPGSAGGRRVGTPSVAEAGVDWFGGNLQAEFRGLRGALRCQRALWRPLGAEFRGNATGHAVTTQRPSLRSDAERDGSGLGRPARPHPPAADRQADHRPRSSAARSPRGARGW
jgi:hypothetical protein